MHGKAERTELRGIVETVRDLPVPQNDFVGVKAERCAVPNNVLMFHRDADLSGGYGALHHRYVLHCALETGGTVVVDGSHIRINPEEAVLVFPHQFHDYADFDDTRISWLFITFELQSDTGLESCRNRSGRLSEDSLWIVERLLGVYQGGTQATDAEEVRLLTGLLLRELHHATSAGERLFQAMSRAEASKNPLMRSVAGYVHANLHRLFSIADVAGHVSYSPSQLRNVFHAKMGMSLGCYVRRARINRAESLLLTTWHTVTEIADKCGYDSVYSFSRAFKNETGMSPTKWKDLHRTSPN